VVCAPASTGFDRIRSSSVSPRRLYCNGTVPLHVEVLELLLNRVKEAVYIELFNCVSLATWLCPSV